MAQHTETRRLPSTAWKPGQTGNPNGRPRRKPITSAVMVQLDLMVKRGGRETHRVALVRRMFDIALNAEPKESIKMIELIWKYLEGMPQQTVEIQYEQAIQDIAARTGAPLAWIRERSRMLSARQMVDGVVIESTAETVERTGQTQASVKRVKV
jgi:hypothetical protein